MKFSRCALEYIRTHAYTQESFLVKTVDVHGTVIVRDTLAGEVRFTGKENVTDRVHHSSHEKCGDTELNLEYALHVLVL